MEWIFSGIGTQLLELVFAIFWGVGGWCILKKIVMQQKQTAGSRSTQVQLGISEQDDDSRIDQKMGNIKQTQIAHEDSVQIQIGSVKHVRKQQKTECGE